MLLYMPGQDEEVEAGEKRLCKYNPDGSQAANFVLDERRIIVNLYYSPNKLIVAKSHIVP